MLCLEKNIFFLHMLPSLRLTFCLGTRILKVIVVGSDSQLTTPLVANKKNDVPHGPIKFSLHNPVPRYLQCVTT